LTIEYKGWIDHALRPLLGMRVFGCDACQDICPYNHGKAKVDSLRDSAIENRTDSVALATWLRLSSSDYRRLTSGTALRRASRWQLLRNASVAAGNSGDPSLIEPLTNLLQHSRYPIVRGHSAWALGQYHTLTATAALNEALATETEGDVLAEIKRAIVEAR